MHPAQPFVLLVPQYQMDNQHLLVYINDVLSSGIIPDLFMDDEIEAIYVSIRHAAKAALVPNTAKALNQFFIDRVQVMSD